jgi:hypothetical protein
MQREARSHPPEAQEEPMVTIELARPRRQFEDTNLVLVIRVQVLDIPDLGDQFRLIAEPR